MGILDCIIQNIKKELKLQKISQNAFAEKMGYGAVHMSNMLRLKKGSMDSLTFVEKASEILKVPISKLMNFDEPCNNNYYMKTLDGKKTDIVFNNNWIKHFGSDEYFIEYMKNDNMYPTIKIGDTLLIAKRKKIKDNGLYIFNVNGTTIIRRLTIQLSNRVILHSDNNSTHQNEVSEHEILSNLVGEVVWIGRILE